jgi:hypothetical protein
MVGKESFRLEKTIYSRRFDRQNKTTAIIKQKNLKTKNEQLTNISSSCVLL